MPLTSIVTPSFNQAEFLERAIESVLNQTYSNIEYVVVDGGSTDGSVQILRAYGDLFAWSSEPDSGQSHAINKGFARASGDIVGYLNSDDILLPHAVATVVRYFQEHPDWDLLYGDAALVDEQGNAIGAYPTAHYSFERLMHQCCICQPAAFWRAAIAQQVGPFNESLSYALDYEYWIRLDRAQARIVHVKEQLAQSRVHPTTKTETARRNFSKEIFQVCRREGGYVDFNYFRGYWYHLCHERDHGLPRLLRVLPGFEARMAWIQHKWWNRHLYSWRGVLRVAKRGTARRLRFLRSGALREP
jgi:glycosyltransferase involved in cell wall biosynthesis